jgi:hypothetical protein
MRVKKFAVWWLAAVIAAASVPAFAIQDDAPLVHPKQSPPKPAGATLLVLCDLACNWKLDGIAKGGIESGASVKVKVEPGQHVVAAATEDALDKIQQIPEVKAGEQTVVSIALQPVRDARIKAARELNEREEKQRVLAAITWADPGTGLIWAKKDNGSDVDWQQASNYCKDKRLAGYSDWRLPTIGELREIYDPSAQPANPKSHVKGGIQSSGWEWSSTVGEDPQKAWGLGLDNGKSGAFLQSTPTISRALCVRRAEE